MVGEEYRRRGELRGPRGFRERAAVALMRAMASLATAYNLAKRFDDAIKVGEEAHQLQLEYLGGDDPLTLETETVLANAYSFVGRIEETIGAQFFLQLAEPLFQGSEAFGVNF